MLSGITASSDYAVDSCILRRIHYYMSKIRRGGFIFQTWIGDHAPRHVHVYRDGRLVLKFDLDHHVVIEGKTSRRVLKLIEELEQEGAL